jgi:hypothetical protein
MNILNKIIHNGLINPYLKYEYVLCAKLELGSTYN